MAKQGINTDDVKEVYKSFIELSSTLSGALKDVMGDNGIGKINDIIKNIKTGTYSNIGSQRIFNNMQKEMIGMLSDSADATKKLSVMQKQLATDEYERLDLTEQINFATTKLTQYQQKLLTNNGKLSKLDRERLQSAVDATDLLKEQLKTQQSLSIAQDIATQKGLAVAESIGSIFDNIPGGDKIAKILGLDIVASEFKKKVSDVITAGVLSGKINFATLGSVGVSAISGIGMALKGLLMNPLTITLVLLATAAEALKAVWDRAHEWDHAMIDVMQKTGFTRDQVKELKYDLRDVVRYNRQFGITIELAAEAATSLGNAFGSTAALSKEMILTTALMSRNFGVATESAAGAVKQIFNLTGNIGKTNQVLNAMVDISSGLGISFAGVMDDIAGSSEEIYTFFNGDVNKLASAALNARRLGLNLKTVVGITNTMTDFESSIEAEMNASAIFGKNINFAAARYSFMTGDVEKGTNLLMQQVESLGEFNKMTIYQKKALAEATGMSVEELGNMTNRKKILASMSADEQKSYNLSVEKFKKFKDIQESSKTHLIQEQKMSTQMEEMNTAWEEIKETLLDTFVPVLKLIIPLLKVVANIVQGMLYPFKLLGDGIDYISSLIPSIGTGFSTVLKYLGGAIVVLKLFQMGWTSIIGSITGAISNVGQLIAALTTAKITAAGINIGNISGGGVVGNTGGVVGKGTSMIPSPASVGTGAFGKIRASGSSMKGGAIMGATMGAINVGSTVLSGGSARDITKSITSAAGSIIGGVAGSFIPIPGVGTMIGAAAGGLLGDALGGPIADMLGYKEPAMAEGGIVTAPTHVLAGEAGPEKIEPLAKSNKFDEAMINLLDQILDAVREGKNIYLDGRQVNYAMARRSSVPGIA